MLRHHRLMSNLLHRQLSSASVGAWLRVSAYLQNRRRTAVLYKYWSILYQHWGGYTFTMKGRGGEAKCPQRDIRPPCRGPQRRSAPPPAHAQWILCRPWQRPEEEESCELSSKHQTAQNEHFKGKLSLRPAKCTLTNFKLPNKLENQGLRQEGKKKKSGDGKDKDPHHRQGFRSPDGHSQMLCAPATLCWLWQVHPLPLKSRQKIHFSSLGKSKHSGGGIMSHSCDTMDYSLPGSSVHEILQAKILTGVGCHFLLQGKVNLLQNLNIWHSRYR